jgi:hypothetical protein
MTPLNKTVKIIELHKRFKLRDKEKILIISIAGILCKVLASQNIKLGKR